MPLIADRAGWHAALANRFILSGANDLTTCRECCTNLCDWYQMMDPSPSSRLGMTEPLVPTTPSDPSRISLQSTDLDAQQSRLD
jgi:hypothetical protein